MENITNETLAFPLTDGTSFATNGMTMRQLYSGMAMQGLLSNEVLAKTLINVPTDKRHSSLAETAVKAADTLIAELNKPLHQPK